MMIVTATKLRLISNSLLTIKRPSWKTSTMDIYSRRVLRTWVCKKLVSSYRLPVMPISRSTDMMIVTATKFSWTSDLSFIKINSWNTSTADERRTSALLSTDFSNFGVGITVQDRYNVFYCFVIREKIWVSSINEIVIEEWENDLVIGSLPSFYLKSSEFLDNMYLLEESIENPGLKEFGFLISIACNSNKQDHRRDDCYRNKIERNVGFIIEYQN